MENSSFSHDCGCSNSEEISHILENLKGDNNYKTLHVKMWTKYSKNQYSKEAVRVLCWSFQCRETPSTHSYHKHNKTIQSSHPITFKRWLLNYPPKWFPLFRFSKQILYFRLLYYMHATCHIVVILLAMIMLIIYGEE